MGASCLRTSLWQCFALAKIYGLAARMKLGPSLLFTENMLMAWVPCLRNMPGFFALSVAYEICWRCIASLASAPASQYIQARSRYRDVYATSEVSADVLKTLGTEVAHDALHLLPLLAMCWPGLAGFHCRYLRDARSVPADRDDIAEDDNVFLLTPWHVIHLPFLTQVKYSTWDLYRLVETVQRHKAFSLVPTNF